MKYTEAETGNTKYWAILISLVCTLFLYEIFSPEAIYSVGSLLSRLMALFLLWSTVYYALRKYHREQSVKHIVHQYSIFMIASALVFLAFGNFTFNSFFPGTQSEHPYWTAFTLIRNAVSMIIILLISVGIDFGIKSYIWKQRAGELLISFYKLVFLSSVVLISILGFGFAFMVNPESEAVVLGAIAFSYASQIAFVSLILMVLILSSDNIPGKGLMGSISISCRIGILIFVFFLVAGFIKPNHLADRLFITHPMGAISTIFENGYYHIHDRANEGRN